MTSLNFYEPCGPYCILPVVFNLHVPEMTALLGHLFPSLQSIYFSILMKTHRNCRSYSHGDLCDANKYRPTFLKSVIFKVLDIVIFDQRPSVLKREGLQGDGHISSDRVAPPLIIWLLSDTHNPVHSVTTDKSTWSRLTSRMSSAETRSKAYWRNYPCSCSPQFLWC